jgi:hypothetical protein
MNLPIAGSRSRPAEYFQNAITTDVFAVLGVFFQDGKMMSCLRVRERLSRPISWAVSNQLCNGFLFEISQIHSSQIFVVDKGKSNVRLWPRSICHCVDCTGIGACLLVAEKRKASERDLTVVA